MKKILLLLFVGMAGYLIFTETDLISTRTNRSSETALVQEKLVELSEWTTLKYEYSDVIISRTDKNFDLFGFGDFDYAEAIKLIEYSGYLKAGTDLSELQMTYNEETKQLSVRIPKSQILDNVVETEKTRVEDIKGTIFSDYPSQIIFDEINVNKQQLEEEKISQGFLDEADKRVESLLTSFLSSNGFEDAVIEFY
nr:DUF4230 domain-containing protein [uncultured Trichococcus sp.]